MSRPVYPHDLDLGPAIDRGTFEILLQSQRDSELVRGVLQALRNQMALCDRTGRQTPTTAKDPLEWRAYHAGGADAAEEMLTMLYAMAHPGRPEEQAENEPDEAAA